MRNVLTLSFDFQSSRKTKPAESKVTKAINGQLLSIRSRIATVAAAVRTSVAQIEFAASQKRQEVTKLEEKERDGSAEIRLRTASGAKLLMYRLTLVATLIVVLGLLERIRISLLAITKSSIERFVLTLRRSCVTMLDMKTASVRDVQHHLSKVLAWVEKGEEVQITRRNKPVAKIVPAEAQGTRVDLPAFAARARQIWGETPVGKSLAQTVVDDRKERA
jgi:prevent-host-death family protein